MSSLQFRLSLHNLGVNTEELFLQMNGVVLEVAHLCLGLLPSPGGLLPSWLDARLVGLGGILFSKTLCSSASAPVVCISPGLSQGIDALRHRLSDPESVHDVPRARRHHGGRNANGPRRGIDQRRTSRSGHRGRRPLVGLDQRPLSPSHEAKGSRGQSQRRPPVPSMAPPAIVAGHSRSMVSCPPAPPPP